MESIKRLFGLSVYTKISPRWSAIASLLLFIVLIAGYLMISNARHEVNPDDKIVPSISQLAQGIHHAVTTDRNGDIPLLVDTLSSLRRLMLGVCIGSLFAILFGVAIGAFPIMEALFLRFLLFFSRIPPLAVLPILFVLSGLGEQTKILLIVLGISPSIALDTYFKVKALPREQLVKALTLGASMPEVLFHVVIPQVLPSALNSIRINLLTAWLFLIAGEAVAADAGLGYRIFVVRRYLAMDTIIPYVLWIAFLAFIIDATIAWWIKHRYPWYEKN